MLHRLRQLLSHNCRCYNLIANRDYVQLTADNIDRCMCPQCATSLQRKVDIFVARWQIKLVDSVLLVWPNRWYTLITNVRGQLSRRSVVTITQSIQQMSARSAAAEEKKEAFFVCFERVSFFCNMPG